MCCAGVVYRDGDVARRCLVLPIAALFGHKMKWSVIRGTCDGICCDAGMSCTRIVRSHYVMSSFRSPHLVRGSWYYYPFLHVSGIGIPYIASLVNRVPPESTGAYRSPPIPSWCKVCERASLSRVKSYRT